MTPAAVREITEREAIGLEVNLIQGRVIYRRPDGLWLIGRDRTTADRNEATIYADYNHDTPINMSPDLIVEVLPDDHGIPPALCERTALEMKQHFDADVEGDILLTNRFVLRMPDGRYRAAQDDYALFVVERDGAFIYSTYGGTPIGNFNGDVVFEILPDEVEPPSPAPSPTLNPNRLVYRYFSPDFQRMFVAAPKNDMVKGWILKTTKQLPPDDCDTLPKLEEWLQSIQVKPETLPPPKIVTPDVKVGISFSGSESGTCRYTCNTSGSGEFRFTANELRDMVNDAIENDNDFDAVVEAASEEISDNSWEVCVPIMQCDDDGFEYCHYTLNNGDNNDFEYSSNQLKNDLKAWIRTNMPEAVERLGL